MACYLVAAGDDAGLRRQLLLTADPVTAATGVLVVGGALGPPHQTARWAVALLVDDAGIWLAGTSGWRLPSPVHFANSHGLILIVAIGESLVAIGVGAAQKPVSTAVIVASALGVVVAVGLWWLYFDVVAHVAERALAATSGQERSRLARDSYTYLHFPIVMSVIFVALGLKKVLEYVSDTAAHDLTDPSTGVPLIALYCGVAVYLLGHVAFAAATSAPGTRTVASPPPRCYFSCHSPGSCPHSPPWRSSPCCWPPWSDTNEYGSAKPGPKSEAHD